MRSLSTWFLIFGFFVGGPRAFAQPAQPAAVPSDASAAPQGSPEPASPNGTPSAAAAEPVPAPAPAPVEPSGSAEPPPPPVAPQFPVPAYDKPPVPTDWDQPTFDPPASSRRRRGSEGSFELQVPIWFTPDDGAIDPGFGFAGRFGLVLGAVVPELHLGWQINWIDEDLVGSYNATMDVFYFSLGARVRFDNRSSVTPFVSGAFDMNFIHMTGDESLVCGYYYCSTVSNYDFTPGFSGKLGVAFELSDAAAIDVGARLAMMFGTGVLAQAEGFVSPFVGFTFYN